MQRKPVSHSPLIGLLWLRDRFHRRRENTPHMTNDMLENGRKPESRPPEGFSMLLLLLSVPTHKDRPLFIRPS